MFVMVRNSRSEKKIEIGKWKLEEAPIGSTRESDILQDPIEKHSSIPW